jgi:hypothetical protein
MSETTAGLSEVEGMHVLWLLGQRKTKQRDAIAKHLAGEEKGE